MKRKFSKLALYLMAIVLVLTFTQCKNKDQSKIEQYVEKINQDCPMVMGEMMQLENVEALPDKKIKLNIHLSDMEGISSELVGTVLKNASPVLAQIIGASPEFKELKDIGATLIFSIKTKDGKDVGEVTLTPDDFDKVDVAPQPIASPEALIENNIDGVLLASVETLKAQLPITDPQTGILIKDCYAENKTMVVVAELPEMITNAISAEDFSAQNGEAMKMMVNANQQMSLLVKSGANMKYIYNKPNGERFAEIEVSQKDLD